VVVYHAALLANPKALAYASGRGLDADTVREFRLGYAAGRLKRYLAFHGWSEELAADLGLVDSRGREWYRGRLVIPEVWGDRAIYLVGRTVPGTRGALGPKYLTLAGAPKPLYGQDRVKSHNEVFIVEGPIDYLLLCVAVELPGGVHAGQPGQAGARRVPARVLQRGRTPARVPGASPGRRRPADVA